MTDASSLTNYNFGFSTHKSDILIHLSQWQYWWWFWFSLFWSLYFFIIVKIVNKRITSLNPVINTSTRGHGKWGDFVVALIPLSWCANILVNSNFILRMIEWQNESSLFTLRVQGKQWYWVYKFDATAAYNILTAPKNIGNNRWFFTTPAESYCADTYYQLIHLGAQLEYKELYLKYLKDEQITAPKVTEAEMLAVVAKAEKITRILKDAGLLADQDKIHHLKTNTFTKKNLLKVISPAKLVFGLTNEYNEYKNYIYPVVDNTTNNTANIVERVNTGTSLFFVKGVINKHFLELLNNDAPFKNILFTVKSSSKLDLAVKTEDSAPLWGFKQKKYKRLQKFAFSPIAKYSPVTLNVIENNKISPFALKSTLVTPLNYDHNANNQFDYQSAIITSRQRSEIVPVNIARRLLRTKRTLVLPAHVNLTVITNSYDVVHSWFIPGLGLKMDCVPGRSTHHSFYIDNVGFYYGQCAEICGRYHHHMPIRVCALPFEQFLVWWQHKGLKRLHRVSIIKQNKTDNLEKEIGFRYTW